MSEMTDIMATEFKVQTETSVFGFDLSGFPAELSSASEAITDLQTKFPDSTPSNVQARYMSPWKSHLITDKFEPIIKLMSELIYKTCIDHYKMDLTALNYELMVADCWCAIYDQGDSAVPHNHFPSDFATVVYLEMATHSAPIVFSNTLEVRSRSATALLFPGSLLHHVPPTDGRRVIVAINFIKIPALSKKTPKSIQN